MTIAKPPVLPIAPTSRADGDYTSGTTRATKEVPVKSATSGEITNARMVANYPRGRANRRSGSVNGKKGGLTFNGP